MEKILEKNTQSLGRLNANNRNSKNRKSVGSTNCLPNSKTDKISSAKWNPWVADKSMNPRS
uniref:Uncharacterized protein n=1 Tax=Mesocestoides corti TaxID=53468 RepID=A0A5K3FVV5_MESCO